MSEAATAAGFSRLFSDDRLTRRAVAGDERAFAAIFRRYHQSLYRFCLAIVGNPEDAQDALQNTMTKVLRALPGEERRIELKPWLYRIAHNESIDLLRRRRETRQLDAEQPAPGYGLAEDAATRERLRNLLDDLGELPERQREVLVMRELAGLEFGEIGMALGTSDGVARQALYEARQSLRQMEEGREMDCEEITRALSDGDGRVTRRRDVRAHLRSCSDCRRFREEIKSREQALASLTPLPAMAAAGMLQGLVGGSQAATGGGLATLLGGGAAKTVGVSAAAKGAATVAVVAAVGVTAADRSGVVHLPLPGGSGSKSSSEAPGAAGAGGGQASDGSAAAGGSHSAVAAHAERHEEPNQARKETSKQAGLPHTGQAPAAGTGHGHGAHPGGAQADVKAQGPPPEHGGGRDLEKQHPNAAIPGQETAAENQPPLPDSEAAGAGDSPARPPKPSPPPSPSPPASAPASPPAAKPEPSPSPQAESKSQPQPPVAEVGAPPSSAGSGKGAEKSSEAGKGR